MTGVQTCALPILLSMDGIVEDEAMTALVFQAFQAGKYDESLLIYLCRYLDRKSVV